MPSGPVAMIVWKTFLSFDFRWLLLTAGEGDDQVTRLVLGVWLVGGTVNGSSVTIIEHSSVDNADLVGACK